MKRQIFIGFDSREAAAFAVAVHSMKSRMNGHQVPIRGIVLKDVQARGLYTRPTETMVDSDGHRRLVDVLSKTDDYNGAMSTEFAISRFLTPHMAGDEGWALFTDCDVMARTDINKLFDLADDRYAVMCVKHNYNPTMHIKMDGQLQTAYSRKNWTSVMLWNCAHPSNKKLTLKMINSLPGRDLHRFCWLEDHEIGEIGLDWNWLVGESVLLNEPSLVHFTIGAPCMAGYENVPFSDEWRGELAAWALGLGA